MLLDIIPKLPMRDPFKTKDYYVTQLGFELIGDYGDYLLFRKEVIEIHFFEFKDLDPKENYGQVYIRLSGIDAFYQELLVRHIASHPNVIVKIQSFSHHLCTNQNINGTVFKSV